MYEIHPWSQHRAGEIFLTFFLELIQCFTKLFPVNYFSSSSIVFDLTFLQSSIFTYWFSLPVHIISHLPQVNTQEYPDQRIKYMSNRNLWHTVLPLNGLQALYTGVVRSTSRERKSNRRRGRLVIVTINIGVTDLYESDRYIIQLAVTSWPSHSTTFSTY